jgi:hypothetical protein
MAASQSSRPSFIHWINKKTNPANHPYQPSLFFYNFVVCTFKAEFPPANKWAEGLV